MSKPPFNRRLFLKITAGAGASIGTFSSVGAVSGDDKRKESKNDEPAVETTSNEDILDAIAGDDFMQAVDDTEYLGVDSQIKRFEEEIQNFPLQNTSFAVLSSGVAADAPGDPEEFASTNVEGREIPNYSPDDFDAFNVAEFRIDFTVPEGAESVAFDYKFGTVESPEFLGTEFQDFFEAALIFPDGSITNIARLPDDTPVTVDNADDFANTPGGSSQDPEPPLPTPQDTVYNAVTELQTAERSIAGFEGEQLTLILRIADASDGIYDSAAFIDNVRFGGEVDEPLRPIRDAFDDWRLAVETVSKGLIRSEARAQAHLYAEHGDEYARPMIDMLGYRAGQVPASELDDEFLEIDEEISAEVDSSEEQQAYEFYQEMFGQVSSDDDPDMIADTFTDYLMGTYPDQSNQLLIDEMTIEEAIEHRVENLNDYEEEFLGDVQTKLDDGKYSGADVQKIASFIEEKIEYMFEGRTEALREESAVIDQLTGPEDFEGDITIADVEDEDGEVSSQALITGATMAVGFAIKKYTGISIAKKVGGIAASGIKSSSTAKSIGSTAKSYGIGTKAQTKWLSNKASAAAQKIAQHTPATVQQVQTVGEHIADDIVLKAAVELVDRRLEWTLGWSPGGKLESEVEGLILDTVLDQGYTGPDECLQQFEESFSIDDVSASDIGPTDYDEGIYPPYGRETGEVTVVNTGAVESQPRFEASLYAQDMPPAGLTLELPSYPVTFSEEIPTIEPGESATIEFEYAVPIGFWTSGYEVRVGFPRDDEQVVDSFDAGVFSALSSVTDVGSGVLSDGDAESHEYQTGQAVGAQATQAQGLNTVTFEMEYSGFNADLHLYDKNGNHVGQNYEAGEFENQIEGAEHSGHDDGALGNERVTVQDPNNTYDVEVVVPEVETITQSESIESQAEMAQQSGGGTVEYEIDAIEVPNVPGKLDAGASQAVFDTPSEPAETSLIVSEVSEQESVSDVTMTVDEFVRDEDIISGERVTFGEQGFDLGASQTKQIEVQIEQPDDFLPGVYSGEVLISGNDGEVTHEETIELFVEPAVPYTNEDDIVDTDGVSEAIADWRAGKIDNETIDDIVEVWERGGNIE